MKLVVDMCLPPDLVRDLARSGYDTVHWSEVGDPAADDASIMEWAAVNGRTMITHDLDFGDLLFMSKDQAPSVIIVREKNTAPTHIAGPMIRILKNFEIDLTSGALVIMTTSMARLRRLPLK